MTAGPTTVRNMVVVLGDQLNRDSSAFDGFDPSRDVVVMAESAEEATCIPQHQQRLVLFFSAMRHFRDQLTRSGMVVHYRELDLTCCTPALAELMSMDAAALAPSRIVMTEPGDHRVRESLKTSARHLGIPMKLRTDRHFFDTLEEFKRYADGSTVLVLENYYRKLRKRHGILLNGDKPIGNKWNFDTENRKALPASGMSIRPPPLRFAPDRTTREVIEMVRREFAHYPGNALDFTHPVTASDASALLDHFIEHRLPEFGNYQDAMAVGEPFLYHSLLSSVLNLHLLDPRIAIRKAAAALQEGSAPINAVAGFIRQILGWREFIRGMYWWAMPSDARQKSVHRPPYSQSPNRVGSSPGRSSRSL